MHNSKTIAKSVIETADVHKAEAAADWLLVKEVQEGNVRAFDQLIRKYRERLYSVIYNMTSNREDSADITQEVFIKAFQSIKKFHGNSSFFTWIYRIAVNTTITHLKKRRLRKYFSFETMQEDGLESEVLANLLANTEGSRSGILKELQEKLNEALQNLSINHRTVVVLHEVEGLSHQEIADVMECSEGTVRSRLHYAKQQLQAELANYLK